MSDYNIIIGLSGSVATIKMTELVKAIQNKFSDNNQRVSLRLVTTVSAKKFIKATDLEELARISVELFEDSDEWNTWQIIGDPVLHIELRKWADMLVIAPLSANTMAKLANGLCNNLLTCVVRAWDMKKPLIFCPAMNTDMWNHPFTNRHVEALTSLGYQHIQPITKRLACGDYGCGAMASIETIADEVYLISQLRNFSIDVN